MTTAYTSLLGLALPVTGELSGTWGDVVNTSITSLLDSAIAGTTTLSSDVDVTLTTTQGAANTSREAIILWTAGGTVTRTITVPAQSKIYTVINKTSSTQSIKIVGAGPTTGVTIIAGEATQIAWNGVDFVKVGEYGGDVSFRNVTVTGTTTLSGLTASTALALDASKNVVSVTNTGTGNNVLSASPTLTGTTSIATLNLTNALGTTNGGTGLTSFTANGVVYASSTSALATGSALTFDGTTLATLNANARFTSGSSTTAGVITSGAAGSQGMIQFGSAQTGYNIQGGPDYLGNVYNVGSATYSHQWAINGSEQMRLTSTGLGIGTSSPAAKVDAVGDGRFTRTIGYGGSANTYVEIGGTDNGFVNNGAASSWRQYVAGNEYGQALKFEAYLRGTGWTTRATLDATGNFGLGVTLNAWDATGTSRFMQVGRAGAFGYDTNNAWTTIYGNLYQTGSNAYKYITSAYGGLYAFCDYNGQHQWFVAASGTAGASATPSQAMTLDASGNLIVGYTTAYDKLQVAGSISSQGGGYVGFYRNGPSNNTGTLDGVTITQFGISSGVATGRSDASTWLAGFDSLRLVTQGVERARIDSSGNLLVGTTTFGQPDVNGAAIGPADGAFRSHHATGTASGTIHAYFTYGGLGIGSITQAGTTGVLYNITSDQRLKENIVDAPEFGSVIDAIQVRSYDWKADGNHQRAGFIAQELVAVAPEAVHQPADPEQMMAVDYSKLVPMLVKEIQSLRKRLADAGI